MALIDVEGGTMTWLKTFPAVTALLGNTTAVYLEVPDDAETEAEYPMVVVTRVGGGTTPGDLTPFDLALLQVDIYGKKDGGRLACWTATQAVADTLEAMVDRTSLKTGVVGCGAEVVSAVYLPDPGDRRPRYSLTVQVIARAG